MTIDFTAEPKAVLDYLGGKGHALTFDYEEMLHEAHHKAFTVAKVTRLDLLADIHESLMDAQKNGKPFQQWKEELKPTLKQYGWWGETDVTNPKTGEVKTIYVGSRRLQTIYETNMRVSYAQARQATQREGDTEYWRYSAILDSKTRPDHQAMHGVILHRDAAFWQKNYPPNGWRCRCKVRGYTKEQLNAKGWKALEEPPVSMIADPDWAYNPGEGNMAKVWAKKLSDLAANCPEQNAKGKHCKQALYDLAKEETIIDAAKFAKWWKYPKESIPIATVPKKMREAMQTKTHEALLSKDTLEKQKENHPELEWYEYLLINHITTKNDGAIFKDGSIAVVVKGVLDRLYLAVFKVTKDRKEVYCTSFRETDREDITREFAKGEKL